tara:strand:- start:646 stop:1317 length:672 start_codon:yes stop_codon:yes gene_type:complete
MGIATAASSGLGAVSSYQSQQQQAAAANAGAIRNYKYQLKVREQNWNRQRSQWENDKINYEETVADNSFAAQEGYARAQRKLNEQFKAAAFAEESDLIGLMESMGEMRASGRTGQSAQRIDNAMLAAFGRNNARRAASLTSAKQGYQQQTEDIRRQQIDENEMAFDEVAFAPQADIAPPAPTMQQGPSQLSLISGLANAGVSGFSAYQGLKAPDPYKNLRIKG